MPEYKDVWVYSENPDVRLELLAKAKELSSKINCGTGLVLLGQNLNKETEEFSRYGANKLYVVDNVNLKEFHPSTYAEALAKLIEKYSPQIMLIGATKKGKEMAPQVAVKTGSSCLSDCVSIDVNEDGNLIGERWIYGGSTIAKMVAVKKPQIATVPPKTFEKTSETTEKSEIIREEIEIPEPKTRIVKLEKKKGEKVGLEEAEYVVCVGRGLKQKEDLKMIEELANALGGVWGVTRPLATDLDWGITEWVGLSGHYVNPNLYIGIGLSGYIQHVAGIRGSKIIVAINKDPEAPIFKVADYGIVGDLYKVVPVLIEAVKKAKK